MVKTKLVAIAISTIISLSISYGQKNKLSLDVNLPIPLGNNFIGQNYKGIADLGLKYNLFNITKLNVGLSGNFGLLTKPDVKAIMIKPRISTEIKVWKINPYVGVGYSLFYFIFDPNLSGADNEDKTSDGLNLNVGLKFHLVSKLYINLGYDFIKLRTEDWPDIDYNNKIHLIEFGVGLQL